MNLYVNSKSSVGGVSNSSTLSLTFTANAAATGSTLIAWVHATSAVDYVTGLHDNNGGTNTWGTPLSKIADPSSGEWTYCFAKYLAPGTTVTSVTMESSSAANAFIYVIEVSGMLSSGAFEAFYNTTTDSAQQLPHSTSFTTTNPNDFALVCLRSGTSHLGTPSSVTPGYTMLANGRLGSDIFYNVDTLQPGSKNLSFTTGVNTQSRYFVYLFRAAVTDPVVSTITGNSVTEGSAVRFTGTLSATTSRTTDYSVSFGGSAVAGTDYDSDLANATFSTGASFTGGVIQLASGYPSFTVDVPTIGNAINQATRTLVLNVTSIASTGGSILDNDPLPSLTISNATESFGVMDFVATLNTTIGQALTFDFGTVDGAKTAGTDYQASSGSFGFNPGDPLTKRISVKVGAAIPPQALRFATPHNYIPDANSVAASTTYLNVRARVPFVVGSGDLSQIVLAFGAWNVYGGTINFLGNAYTVVSCALESDTLGTYAPVYFAGLRNKSIADGTAEALSDPVLPSAFGLVNFAKGTKLWIRVEYSVASTGLKLPRGKPSLTQWGTGAASAVLTSGAVASAVDAVGAMTFTSGNAAFTNPYTPIVLGKFVSGDKKTFIGIGDQILAGVGDTSTGFGQVGSFSLGLTDADHYSNPVAGANFAIGTAGATAAVWIGANSSILTNYLKYAKYAVDQYGVNSVETSLATAQAESQALWALCSTAGIKEVLRPMLIPRTSNTDGTVAYSSKWSTGGDARLFNDWLRTYQLGNAQGVTIHALRMQAVRIDSSGHGSPFTSDTFYHWLGATAGTLGTSTNDGFIPNATGYAAQAANYRAAFGVLN